MAKDWIGNNKSIFVTLGASNHTDKERQSEDYYATDPIAAKLLLEVEPFEDKICECACGEKHLARVFEDVGYEVRSSDIVDRCGNEIFDFWASRIASLGRVISLPIHLISMRPSLFIRHCRSSLMGTK